MFSVQGFEDLEFRVKIVQGLGFMVWAFKDFHFG